MAIAFRSSVFVAGAGTSPAVNVPAGTVNGDLMIAFIAFGNQSDRVLTIPSGWTGIGQRIDGSIDLAFKVWRRVADNEPASYTWTWDIAPQYVIAVGSWSGVDTTTPVNSSASLFQSNTVASTFHTTPSFTPNGNGKSIIGAIATNDVFTNSATPDTSPAATEDIEAAGNNCLAYVQRYLQPTQAAISLDATTNASAQSITAIFALNPGAEPTVPKIRTVRSSLRW